MCVECVECGVVIVRGLISGMMIVGWLNWREWVRWYRRRFMRERMLGKNVGGLWLK